MTNLLPADRDAAYAVKYPTLTSEERGLVAIHEADIAELEEQIAALQSRLRAVRDRKASVMRAAALRDVTPEQVSLTYRTTGQGYDDLVAIVTDMHAYLYGVGHFGILGQPMALAPNLGLTRDQNDPEQVPSLAAALVEFARLCAPDGGLTIDVEQAPAHEVDWQWVEHAQGLHPVDIVEDDLGRTRSLLLAHSADGDRAVLLDNRRRYRAEGPIATGTLAEVLTETFRIVREEQPAREDEG